MHTDDVTAIASRAAIITSMPAIVGSLLALAFAIGSFMVVANLQRREHLLCIVLKQESVLYIKKAQLADAAEKRAEANTKAPQTHMWQAEGLLDRELALQNASLCGFPQPTPLPKGTTK